MSSSIPDSEFNGIEITLKANNSAFHSINGINIHYRFELNNELNIENKTNEIQNSIENKPFIVLIHGFGGGLFSFKQCWTHLLSHSSGLLAFDRPGFGLTDRPLSKVSSNKSTVVWNTSNNPYSIDFSIEILKILLNKFGIRKCILISHSTGSAVATLFCQKYSSIIDIQSLILVSPSIGMPGFIRSILKTKLGKTTNYAISQIRNWGSNTSPGVA